ncbi:conserved oligomeric Golgi complex subunit 2 [Episyrphus balteatus]|uniref:conserved oligomeric Golgi complex subunit 2 n=1 Tax=Episyrphus balteatus TaxID=286459 RepID=UPI0024858AAD|nr:conserved oligomeric Golgi complex subunit 2 [Episyrphus balteatus]
MQSNDDMDSLVAAASTELCFDKNEFMKTNFSVDEFLHRNRNAPSLELLRDNLGVYLKVLRSSMIDLINEDYADFVSLSANLVGLDQSIGAIRKPLEVFREEILSIKDLINENEKEVSGYLKQKNDLRILKRNLQSLKKVFETMSKLEELLTNKLNTDNIKPVDLERAALELIQLKFNKKFCEEYLTNEQLEKIVTLNEEILKKLRLLFNSTLKTSTSTSSESLERCLRIYITLDACSEAELVFKEDIVGPYMSNTISEQHLQNSPQGLAGIYNKVLNFISLHMTDLLRITQYSDKMKGFNFLVNSFWSDVEQRLEAHMSSIFAPGNSEVFYVKYKCTRDFIQKIEEILQSDESIQLFRQHSQTKSFHSRWNLPVYFQICFQEIAGQFEAVLDPILDDSKVSDGGEFHLIPFNSALKAIDRCWSDGVYLYEVFPKFFKLTIQIILRLSHWINDAITALKRKDLFLKISKTNMMVFLYADTTKFIEKLPYVLGLLSSNITENNDVLSDSMDDVKETLQVHLAEIEKALIDILTVESIESIQQVNDLPRLYRKTNRDVPTRNSGYVEQMLKPVKVFQDGLGDKLDEYIVQRILEQVFIRITKEYYQSVTEVLTSVQKTEESLRRLKNLKEKTANQQPSAGGAMSDDDKIRLQLRVDVGAWTKELANLNFMPTQIDKLLDLNNMVEETIKLRDAQS